MKISSLHIKNFRGIKELRLELGETTVLIGENNSGKSSVLDAIRLCLGEVGPRTRHAFDVHDFHVPDGTADPSKPEPIEIVLDFLEATPGEWGRLLALFSKVKILQVDGHQRGLIRFQVVASREANALEIQPRWSFLDLNGLPLPNSEEALRTFLQSVKVFYLSSLRDAERQFDSRGQYWRHFLRGDPKNPTPDTTRRDLEGELRDLNDRVIESHGSFAKVKEGLSDLEKVVPTLSGDVVSIEAIPPRMADILEKSRVFLSSSTGAKLPVHRHGEGTQSLAVLMLFSAYLRARSEGSSIVTLEEPEAHLHPSAVRSLWKVLEAIPGQKLISTHSGDLLSEVDVHSVIRLARTNNGTTASKLGASDLDHAEVRKFSHHVRRARGELLFARVWLLVEGETELWIYPAAARALGIDLHRLGIRVVEFAQVGLSVFAKTANRLGLHWYCVADGDPKGMGYTRTAAAHLDSSTATDRFCNTSEATSEMLLAKNGFGAIYEALMPAQNRPKLSHSPGDPPYWEEFMKIFPYKTAAAAEAAMGMEARTHPVPAEMRTILEKVRAIAESS